MQSHTSPDPEGNPCLENWECLTLHPIVRQNREIPVFLGRDIPAFSELSNMRKAVSWGYLNWLWVLEGPLWDCIFYIAGFGLCCVHKAHINLCGCLYMLYTDFRCINKAIFRMRESRTFVKCQHVKFENIECLSGKLENIEQKSSFAWHSQQTWHRIA